MSGRLLLRNRQQARALDLRVLRRIARTLLETLLPQEEFELGLVFTGEREMTRLNETFLRHAGSTDVITFDYREAGAAGTVCGEIVVCVDEALVQARRFRCPWQCELVRYIVHGVLHLRGYDDRGVADRRRMRQAENRLLRQLRKRFKFGEIGIPSPARAR